MVTELYFGSGNYIAESRKDFFQALCCETNAADVVFYQQKLNIKKKNDIYNSVSFFNQLENNKIYKLTVNSIEVLEGQTKAITFLVRDNGIKQAIFAKSLFVGQKNEVLFSTKNNAEDLELKVYSGEIKKANGIAIKLSDIKLQMVGDNVLFEENRAFFSNAEAAYRGFLIAEQYCLEGKNTFYLVVNQHIGDAVRCLRMIQAFRSYYSATAGEYHFEPEKKLFIFKKRKRIDKLIVLTTPSVAGVANLYKKSIDKIITLNTQELLDLEIYACSSLCKDNNIIPDEDIFYRGTALAKGECAEVKAYLYGFGDLLWNYTIPKDSKPAEMEIDESIKSQTNLVINNLNMEPQKTIILCPAAQSSSMLDSYVWENFANLQRKNGYRVFTNVAGNETPIFGTEGLSIGVDVLCDLAYRGCCIIGVQCGVMDVLAEFNKCKKLIILNPIITESDKHFAKNRNATAPFNHFGNKIYLRIEKFEIDYILDLIERALKI